MQSEKDAEQWCRYREIEPINVAVSFSLAPVRTTSGKFIM